MKTIYITSILLLVMGFSVMGQTSTVYTPWGTSVDVWTQQDMDTDDRHDYDDLPYYVFFENNGAIFLPTLPGGNPPYPSSSSKFNCHGYAWYMYWRESNQFNAPWHIDKDEAEKYFDDQSYVECSEADADIFWINNGAHSALATEDPDDLLSKWANGPLAIHGKGSGESPWPTTSSNTTYYKKCLEEISTTYYSDISVEYCAINFINTIVSNYVDLEVEYAMGIKIEGTFLTGTGATLYFHPE